MQSSIKSVRVLGFLGRTISGSSKNFNIPNSRIQKNPPSLMLEGEELFENAKETAYRVCTVPTTYSHPYHMEWNRIFSAHWDPTGMERSLKYMMYKERNLRASLSLSLSHDRRK